MLFDLGINQVHHADNGQRADQGVVRVVNSAGNVAVGVHSLKVEILVEFLSNFKEYFLPPFVMI
jgi:hypothetical protein